MFSLIVYVTVRCEAININKLTTIFDHKYNVYSKFIHCAMHNFIVLISCSISALSPRDRSAGFGSWFMIGLYLSYVHYDWYYMSISLKNEKSYIQGNSRKGVRMISDLLFVTLHKLSIYSSGHKQLIRYHPNTFREFPCICILSNIIMLCNFYIYIFYFYIFIPCPCEQ